MADRQRIFVVAIFSLKVDDCACLENNGPSYSKLPDYNLLNKTHDQQKDFGNEISQTIFLYSFEKVASNSSLSLRTEKIDIQTWNPFWYYLLETKVVFFSTNGKSVLFWQLTSILRCCLLRFV